MRTTLDPHELLDQESRLRKANLGVSRQFPGAGGERQPVHTVYGGAHLFRAETPAKLGALALRTLEVYAPDAAALAEAMGMPGEVAERVRERVMEKLRREPVEDYRIDFEDGYGHRPGAEEDADAERAAREVARAAAEGTLPPFVGIRVKPLDEELRWRAVRTLDVFLTALLDATGGALPPGLRVTLPKVTAAEQVDFLGDVLETLEMRMALGTRSLRFEIMVEDPRALVAPDGRMALPELVRAGGGRITGAHFGAYDYTAAIGVTAAHQHLRHPACDFARQVMLASLAGTGVALSDGATTAMPIPPHRSGADGAPLSEAQRAENRATVHRAWRTHHDDVRHSLASGFYQGWDLHPAQLVTRYAAVFAFFLEGMEPAAARLRNFVERAAQATRVGDAFDDAATGQGLLNFFLRAVQSGALPEDEASARTGLTPEELRGRSFARIVEARGAAEPGAAGDG
ncbi:MAG TPA: hypothetical protein VFR81_16330 [Longimicrobium sp.]|nr:hypothetical protein [Longimicrobium sp.]